MDDLGLEVTGQRLEPDRAVLACRVLEPDDWCRRCGCQGRPRDTVVRRLAHEPFGWRPTTLLVTVRRCRCTGCGHVWRQDTTAAAEPRAKISRAGLAWALVGIVCQHVVAVVVIAYFVAQGRGPSMDEFMDSDITGARACYALDDAEGSGGNYYRDAIGRAAQLGVSAATPEIRQAIDDGTGDRQGAPGVDDLGGMHDACEDAGYEFKD